MRKHISTPVGPQKIHTDEIPRFGGLSIFMTMILISTLSSYYGYYLFFKFLIISMPVFVLGFFEDITQAISPRSRLLGCLLSGFLFILIFEISIKSIGIPVFDKVLNYEILSIIFTILCITFLIQAFNIIDGLNGLSLTTAILGFLAVSIIAYIEGDESLSFSTMYIIFILLGVLVLNFPFGKIFLGDAGAYLIGLYLALAVIMLIERNINISPFVIAQILIYPAYELFRSIFRRILRKKNIMKPDKKHLHSLIHTLNKSHLSLSSLKANAYTSVKIILLQIINFTYVMIFYKNELLIIWGIISFIILYETLYFLITKKITNFNK